MILKCVCGNIWNYQGHKTVYASCPNCMRKVKISPELAKELGLEEADDN